MIDKKLAGLGYDLRWTTLSAAEVGAPHKRERWFLLAYANSYAIRSKQIKEPERILQAESKPDGSSKLMAYSHGSRKLQQSWGQQKFGERSCDSGEDIRDTNLQRLPLFEGSRPKTEQDGWAKSNYSDWWAVEPDVDRMVNGPTSRLDRSKNIRRLKAIGNGVVPQQVQAAFKELMGIK